MVLALLLACTSPSSSPEPPVRPGAQRPADNDEEPERGRWNRARDPLQSEEIAQLEAIGYVGGVAEGTGKVGVTVNLASAQPGLNFWTSGHRAEATLMTMDGAVLHTWSMPFREVWPDRKVSKSAQGPNFWRRAKLLPDGSILAVYEGHGLIKLDRDSKLLWAWDGRAHHDIEVLQDGRIWVLSREAHTIPGLGKRPVLEDFATLLSADGKVLQQISVLAAVRESGLEELMARVPRKSGDIFHTNSIEHLDGRVAHPAFVEGNLLLSLRAPSAILVLDPRTGRVPWWHAGEYAKQHDPTVLPNGNLLLFDNLGMAPDRSSVREYSLPAMEPVWSYMGGGEPFFSRFCGAAQRLANGNTLVSESGVGRAFEVDPGGTVVWAFDNPNRSGDDGEFVAIVPELVRLPADAAPWLGAGTP